MKNKEFNFTKAKLIRSGHFYLEKLILLIEETQYQIIINIYEFENDESGEQILNALVRALKRKVEVYLLFDSFGSMNFSSEWIDFLRQKGAKISFFNPFFSSNTLEVGRRLHQKVFIFDQEKAFVGGINISNDYLRRDGPAPWLDYVFYIDGEIVKRIARITTSYHHQPVALLPSISMESSNRLAKVLIQDFWKGKFELSKEYKMQIENSQKNIYLMNAYFFPGKTFLRQLKDAADRGVKIKMVLGGSSDIPVFRWAQNCLYQELLEHKIEIYEWKQSVLHAKIAIVDSRWCTVGSFNLDYISQFANIEMNITSEDQELVNEVEAEFLNICSEISTPVDIKLWHKYNHFFMMIRDLFALFLLKLARYISLFHLNSSE